MEATKYITLRGVRVHNLKNIDAAIPLYGLTVVTGVSGAGKSSLVFDTLYAEAQRRYLQSFSTYTRQFLERFDKPDAEAIGDLPPAVAIRGGTNAGSQRRTVGSLTEISDDLRLLFARAGKIICPGCGQAVTAHRPRDVLAALQAMPAGTRCTLAFPAVFREETDQAEWLNAFLEEGYFRIQVGPAVYRLGEQTVPHLSPTDKIWVLLDRVEIGKTSPERLLESIETAFRRGDGRLGALTDSDQRIFDERYYCSRCDRLFPTPEPRLFDYHDPLGACPQCHGNGVSGKGGEICPACQGKRWNPDALAVRLRGMSIADMSEQALEDLLPIAMALPRSVEPSAQTTVVIEQMHQRLQELVSMRLGYLTLERSAASLSAGETKRIALTAALASNLVQVLYLVDEPTTDLHARDTSKLLDGLLRLRERGNTLVVIDNDRDTIAAADHVIDLGPGAGEEGGQVTYHGAPAGLRSAPENPTSDFWCERSYVEIPATRRKHAGFLKVTGASANNLRDLSVDFPLGVLCVVTGVSGAGKRSLVEQTLVRALEDKGERTRIAGVRQITDVVLLDQESLPRSSRSNPATYLKIFDEIRTLFAETVDARIRNFGPGQFSFNQPGGRCETCEGQGTLTIDMQFLADVVSTCPECLGRRYRKEILDIKVRSLSIAEVLDLTIREAFRFFRAQPKIEKKLKWLLDVGLEYLRLGQALETLSFSECQRLKWAGHLASSRKPGCLYVLAEPTVGLHPADVVNLLACFDRLLAAGHALIVIEHDLDVIGSADWVIDLGPEGGKGGGRLVAHGTPEDVAQVAESHTGRLLGAWLASRR